MSFSVFKKPRFGDLKIKWEGELDPEALIEFVNKNLSIWIEQDVPSIWVKLSGANLNHLTKLMDGGFNMHRIKDKTTLVMNKWVRLTSFNLPPAPFSYLGVGAMCINKEGLILVVKENFKTGPGPWKLPGGLLDPSNDKKFSDAAIRECFEETGVRAKFDYIAVQRFKLQSSLFHLPDVYTVCKLTPITEEIKFDPVEIADCKWITKEEFFEDLHPLVRRFMEPALKIKVGFHEHPFEDKETGSLYYTPIDEE